MTRSNAIAKKNRAEREYEPYQDPEYQTSQGPGRRRGKLTEIVPVRFPEDMLDAIRARADADDRPLSAWIRRAVEHELDRERPAS